MSSSQDPAFHGGDENNADDNDDSLFVNGNNDGDAGGEGEPEPQLPNDNNEGVEGEENPEPDAEDDSSSEVGPEVLDELSDDEKAPSPRPRPRCRNRNRRAPRRCRNCAVVTRQWHDEVTRITAEFRDTERRLKDEIKKLKIELLKARGGIHWDPWRPRLLEFIRNHDPNPDNRDLYGYRGIYLDSCKQGNMSTDINDIHPDLSLDRTVYSRREIQNHFQAQWLHDRYNGAFNDLRGRVHPLNRDIVFPLRFTRLNQLPLLRNAPFDFERLPIAIQRRIWELLIPNGQLVSKRWYYATAHLFYATNTFAFSSLGEFGRFCNGIKRARVERLVHVELTWQGALMPRQPKGVSLRKQPLAWFMYTSRLRTLAIHINESGKSRMRRPYEMMDPSDYYKDFASDEYTEAKLDIFGMEVRRTDCHPNYRKTRSLRTVQGMDFIYQLRGMKWVRFYDTNALNSRRRIRDWSFTQDVNNVVRRKKSDSMALKTEIENLPALTKLEDFSPDDELEELIKRFYDETPVEDVSVGGSETSSSSSPISEFPDDSEFDIDSGDSSCGLSGTSRSSQVIEIVDSDTEMSDDRPSDVSSNNESQSILVDLTDSMSESESSSRRSLSGNAGVPYESGLHTTVTPQPQAIVIVDDDDDSSQRRRERRSGGLGSDSDGLFLPSRSGTAASTGNVLSSDNERRAEVIDLTREDLDEGAGGPRDSADPDPDTDLDSSQGSVAGPSRKRSGDRV
ncbi:hypothetical protein FHL15_003454 [Xylaria flabelliformis]|uniref:Uncharacterized protein n=1 Tax=Xylaria flabelliformis TaxID=2512241 RepID=A0A553I5L5_9PEZI|nr:hypothetical protein FHL15_003454 [Xylaria flabelliformis]